MRQLMLGWMMVLGFALPAGAEAPAPPRAWVLGQVEVPTRYYYRGYVQERNGAIIQPAVKVGLDVFRSEEGPIQRISPLVGIRSSFHSRKTGASGSGPSNWYEADLVGGVQVQMFERLEAELAYVAITSPNGAFNTIEEINLDLRYFDEGLWPNEGLWPAGFAINPYANFKFEINGSALGGPQGTLLQLGVEPGFWLFEREPLPLRLSFPVETGISLDNYYFLPQPFAGADSTFGYVKAGVSATMPLFFVPPDYGQWLMTVGADYINLGDNLETFAGRRDDVIGRLTLRVRF